MKNILFFLVILFSCSSKKAVVISPPGYDLSKPAVIELPLELDEISGLSYYASDRTIFAISDEKGYLFKINPFPSLQIKTWKFSKKADFEDIVLLDSTFYILQSNGDLHLVKFLNDTVSTNEIKFPFKGKYEFETLFYDSVLNRLQIICKNCENEKKGNMNIYSFDPQQKVFVDSIKTLDFSSHFQNKKGKKFNFKASAAAIHPLTGDLYIISSINSLLIILDKNKKLKSFYSINRGMFKQPEGITFTENGTMIISNESANEGAANLLFYTYTP